MHVVHAELARLTLAERVAEAERARLLARLRRRTRR